MEKIRIYLYLLFKREREKKKKWEREHKISNWFLSVIPQFLLFVPILTFATETSKKRRGSYLRTPNCLTSLVLSKLTTLPINFLEHLATWTTSFECKWRWPFGQIMAYDAISRVYIHLKPHGCVSRRNITLFCQYDAISIYI